MSDPQVNQGRLSVCMLFLYLHGCSFWYSGFVPQSKDTLIRSPGYSKLSIGVNVYVKACPVIDMPLSVVDPTIGLASAFP